MSGRSSGKQAVRFGVPWETTFGYAQAVRAGPLVFISGQLSHDEAGNMIAPASPRADGAGLDPANMEAQMGQAYANAGRALRELGLDASHIAEEVMYVTDMAAAFAAGPKVRRSFYQTDKPEVACTLIVTPELALPGQLIEIKFIAASP